MTRPGWSGARRIVGAATGVLLLVAAVVLLVLAVTAHANLLPAIAGWANILDFVLAAVLVANAVFAWVLRRSEDGAVSGEKLDAYAADLGELILAQWRGEAESRPRPMRLRWSAGQAPSVYRPRSGSGETAEIVAMWRRLNPRQLAVLGDPGTGKSTFASLLVQGLLGDPRPGEPIPVLLSMNTWNPVGHRRGEHLHTWMARRIARDYEADERTVRRLLVTRRLLPVLDGLDELPGPAIPAAIDAVVRAVGDSPFLVTCRTEAYRRAVDAVQQAPASVTLLPAEPSDVERFLTAGGERADRWSAVLRRVRSGSVPGLAEVFTVPLMVSLARDVYADPATDPRELGRTGLQRREEIERHLFRRYVETAYSAQPPAPETPASARPRYGWGPDQARRWLGHLARHTRARQTPDIAWWQLGPPIPSVVGLALLTGVVAYGRSGTSYPYLAATAASVALATGGLRPGTAGSTRPLRSVLRLNGWSRKLRVVVVLAGVAATLGGGWADGPLGWIPAAILMAVTLSTLQVLITDVQTPAADLDLVDMRRSVAADRSAMLVQALVVGPPAAVMLTAVVTRLLDQQVELAHGFFFALVFIVVRSAWGQRMLFARALLALTGRLPWRSVTFLEDAHRRRILRQVGTVYQFRHARLRDHLAGDGRPPHTTAS
ncbi:NACHT domain-containing protein [Plantactinospora veratri]|uniref:NACHT domain-containing protein n=1 Tax=Plantactinospora veratri TaxID=1436122 RepID=A0ABU7SM90_9ACTN